MMLGHPPEEVDLSHETTTEPDERDFWVRALPQDTYSDRLKRIVREMLRTSRRRRPDAMTLYQNLIEDMEVWRLESVEGRRYIRRIKEEEVDEEVVEEGKEVGKEAKAEVEVGDKEEGKAAEVEVVDLEGDEDDEEGEEEGEEEEEEGEEENERRMEIRRGKMRA